MGKKLPGASTKYGIFSGVAPQKGPIPFNEFPFSIPKILFPRKVDGDASCAARRATNHSFVCCQKCADFAAAQLQLAE
jgi:hypothetical protein